MLFWRLVEYHNFYIHSFVVRNLGCFQNLTIINNALMSMSMHMSFQIDTSMFWGRHTGMELQGHM